MRINKQTGFTLIELLIVIGIIAILAAVVIVAINPARQFGQAGDAARQANITTISDALVQYQIDNLDWPASVTTTETEICTTGGTCTGLIDLSVLTDNGTYLGDNIPVDPSCPDTVYCVDANGTGYTVYEDANGRVVVTAPLAVDGTIDITR
jgi:prepilin-type N-terminal cleavage/methylation domain-containing protein